MYEFHLFAGIGGGILGGMLNGNTPVGAIEIEKYPRKILAQRQLDGCLPIFPIWDDVCTFRSDNPECSWFIDHLRSIRENLRICGGFPCQDISIYRHEKGGISGERSGLWFEFARILNEIRPTECFLENSPVITVRGLDRVLASLAELGYDAQWGIISAPEAGVKNVRRKRWWLLGNNTEFNSMDGVEKRKFNKKQIRGVASYNNMQDYETSQLLSNALVVREINGIPGWMERFRAIGNAQVPQVAALAERILNN